MSIRLPILLAALLCAAQPVAAADTLPRAMLGTWAGEASDCTRDESEGRIKVEPRWIESFASGYSIRTWTKRGDVWHGRGRQAQEGEGGTTPGSVALRLMPDGRLRIGYDGGPASAHVKCARDRGVH